MLEKYMAEIKASGYSEQDRYQILKSGITRYETLRKKEEDGVRPFYRARNFKCCERNEEKGRKRTEWFKKKDNKFATVFFVPPTPGSVLLKNLKKTEEKHMIDSESRIKFVEMSGRKYIDFFKTTNPLSKNCDPEEKCMICKDSKRISRCKTSNVGYSISCKLCKERNKEISYEGETARTGYIRGREHQKELENKSKRSVLYKHVLKEHQEEQEAVEFQMKIVKSFHDPLNRQIDESIRIRSKNPNSLLNSKAEFHGPCIKRKVYE